ncbi:MAG: c-type cytochrome domain-containing protein [Gemmataceae bacterium]
MKQPLGLLAVIYLWATVTAPARGASNDTAQLAEQGVEYLRKYCYECHGLQIKKAPLHVLQRDVLLAQSKRKFTYVIPGKPAESYLWERIEDGTMPPDDVANRPTAEENQRFRAWIEAGAPFPEKRQRAFKGEKEILRDIFNHLTDMNPADREFQRYFSITHLYNNPSVREAELRLHQAALSKLINSLSWQPSIVLPIPIDPEKTIYNIDLRKLGWHRTKNRPDLWRQLLKEYPYGLQHDRAVDPQLRRLANDVYALTDCYCPHVRADWFIATASQPPLYHAMLELPDHLAELEKKLNVDSHANLEANQLVRAAIMESGVSRHNRLLERHETAFGSYWKSFDFDTSGGRGNLLRFPLGPPGKDNNRFQSLAFQHAGGEMIFNLPNGLQGYLLVDENDKRIDRGPIAIVRDFNETGGTPEVVNGLSCISCHKHGMIGGFQDMLREQSGVFGEARLKLRELHPEQQEIDRLLAEDTQRFMKALEKATGSFLKVAEDRDKDLKVFDDPVGKVAKAYIMENLDLNRAAYELGLDNPQLLENKIKADPRLKQYGLGPLLQKDKIKREVWESVEKNKDLIRGYSLFHLVVLQFNDLGTPYLHN